jgi:tetratricopeptide (TPR) repeat protein
MADVADAAHALHEAGVVHRDIKPGNVLVGRDGARATLMDLGLAQVADEVDGKLTRTRQFVGTLRYASPEQVLAVGRVDRRADVYGLGATLWELLALRPLFGATDQTPTPQLMMDIQQREPDRLRGHNRAVGRDLEAVVHRCLEKRPERRYPTAKDLADDLRRVLAGEPVVARPVTSLDRGLKWARRNPVIAGAAAAVFLALVTGTAVSISFAVEASWQAYQAKENEAAANRARDEAERERNQAASAAEKARRAYEVLVRSLQATDWLGRNFPAIPRPGGQPTPKAGQLVEVRNFARRELAQYPVERGRVLLVVSNTFRGFGNYDLAEETLRDADRAIRDASDATLLDRFRVDYCRASLWHDTGNLPAADRAFSVLLERPPQECENVELADAHFRFAWLSIDRAVLPRRTDDRKAALLRRARDHVKAARELYAKAPLGPDLDLRLAACDLLQGVVEWESIGSLAATPAILRAVAQLPISHELGLALALYYRAERARESGKHEERVGLLIQLDELAVKVVGPEHPIRGFALGALAGAERDAGRMDAAVTHIRQALEIGRRWAPHHPRMVEGLRELARLYKDRRQYSDAVPLYEIAVEIAKLHPDDLPGEAESLAAELNQLRQQAGAGPGKK